MSRLFEQYNSEIKKSLQEKFQYGNVMEIPKLEKIVINIGVGDAVGNAKALEAAVNDLTIIAGQKPVITKAKNPLRTSKFVKVWRWVQKLLFVAKTCMNSSTN